MPLSDPVHEHCHTAQEEGNLAMTTPATLRTRRRLRRASLFVAAGACTVAAGLAAGLVLTFTGGAPAPAARARLYTDFQACLLTSERGLADPAAAPVWAGMEQASLVTHAKVSYLAVAGPQTMDNALPFLGSLLVRHCGLVLAAGQAEREAVTERAREYPLVKFAVVGGVSAAPNMTVLSGSAAAARSGAASAVAHAAGG
jgi:basic membrane lipoprotein Med (substrate-binding protein (PBP1-ABC) superfamily)